MLSPYSVLSLVRQRIQVHASDYGGWVCLLLFTSRSALFLVGRPMKLGIMAGMPRRIVMSLAAHVKAGFAGGHACSLR